MRTSRTRRQAVDVVKEGIAQVSPPEGVDLMVALAGYYKDAGNTTDARAYLTQARAGAKALRNNTLVSEIDQMLAALAK